MTSFDKHIYNTWLYVTRTNSGKPFRARKNFDKFEDDKNYVFVQKLNRFFTKYKNIEVSDFFLAPYKVYPDNTMYDLKFYLSQKAIKIYKIYEKKIENKN